MPPVPHIFICQRLQNLSVVEDIKFDSTPVQHWFFIPYLNFLCVMRRNSRYDILPLFTSHDLLSGEDIHSLPCCDSSINCCIYLCLEKQSTFLRPIGDEDHIIDAKNSIIVLVLVQHQLNIFQEPTIKFWTLLRSSLFLCHQQVSVRLTLIFYTLISASTNIFCVS